MSISVRKHKEGRWDVDVLVRLPNGKKIRERTRISISSRTAARRWGEERERFLAVNGNEVREEVPTLATFASRYIEQYAKANRQKHSTIVQKERVISHYLLPRMGKKTVGDISDADVQKLKSDLVDRNPKTVNNVLTVLNTMLKCAVKWRLLDRMPCTIDLVKVDRVTEAKFYEPYDYERLVEAARKIDPRIYLFVLLGGDAGLRCGEIIGLEWSDVDVKRGFLTVRRSEWEGHVSSPKGRRERKVRLTARLKQALQDNWHLKTDRVLWRDDGFPGVTQVLLAKWMCRAQRRAGLKVTGGIHILRHTFCSRLAMAGATPVAIGTMAGHASLSTTAKYLHLSPAAMDQAIALLDAGADLAASPEAKTEVAMSTRLSTVGAKEEAGTEKGP
jgi:integrase